MHLAGMPNATTNNSLCKICNPNDQSINTPLVKMRKIALPAPLRIDTPANEQHHWGGHSTSFGRQCTQRILDTMHMHGQPASTLLFC